jgi:DNA recombination protein RmuC
MNEVLLLLLVALIAAILAGAFVWLYLRSRQIGWIERLRAREAEAERLNTELAAARAECARLSTSATQLSTQLEAERSAHERLTNEFKALSADALRTNRTDFLEQAKQAFAQLQQQSTGELEQRKQAVEALVKPLRESLEKVDTKISEIEKARAGAYGALGEQLKALNLAQNQLQTEAARLSTALRSTTYAGSWGELQLRRVVEMADMVSYCDFTEQESSGGLRADLVVRLPGGQRVVVDAKTPLESFRAAASATDEAVRADRLAEHAQKVRGHIDALGAKNYWEQFQPAPEFVVLFLPGDHFLTAALGADNTLLDRALAKRVLLATPTTLIALLKAAAYGWRQEAISKNAEEISGLGRALHDRVAAFAEHLDKIGRELEAAVKGYNTAVGSFEATLLPGARKLAELGARGARELNPPDPVETAAREVMKRS